VTGHQALDHAWPVNEIGSGIAIREWNMTSLRHGNLIKKRHPKWADS